MSFAWTNQIEAFQFAFGRDYGPLADTIVLLHKDRLSEIQSILDRSFDKFKGRWQGFITWLKGKSLAFILTDGGAADVCDCVLHISVFPPRKIIFTGTCGGLNSEIRIGDLCLIEKGWIGSDISTWLANPQNVVRNAKFICVEKKMNSNSLKKTFKNKFGFLPLEVSGFSVPFQALESPQMLHDIYEIGADVVDMESIIFLAVSEYCGIPGLALLWCTDRPGDSSFYKKPTISILETQQKLWSKWPEVIVSASNSIIEEKIN